MRHTRRPRQPTLLCVNFCALLQDLERVLHTQEVAVRRDTLDALLPVLVLHLLVIHRGERARLVLKGEIVERRLDLLARRLGLGAGLLADEGDDRVVHRA